MRRILLLPPALALALAATPATAQQQDGLQEDGQLWLQANTNIPVAANTRITLEQIARWSDRQRGLYQTEFGVLLGYRVARNVELGLGYREVAFHNGNDGADEHRLRQQIVATFGPVLTRLRIDERIPVGGGEIGLRIRPLVRFNQPLNRRGLSAYVSHESFYLPNSTDWGQRSGYERMRNIIGLSFPIAGGLSADVGYLNQYRPERGTARAQMDHALTIQLTINLDSIVHPSADD